MSKISNFMEFFKKHLSVDLYIGTFFALLSALIIIPGYMFLPDFFGYENSVLENLQMFVLICACFFAIKTKDIDNKKFFNLVFLVLTILMIREVNCGRTIFFAIPGEVNEFYRWSEIKYGWLAHPLFGIYIASVAIYFLKNKLFLNIWNIIKTYKFPIFSLLLMLLGMATGIYGEEVLHNAVFEELAELLFYVALASIIYLYSQKKQPLVSSNKEA